MAIPGAAGVDLAVYFKRGMAAHRIALRTGLPEALVAASEGRIGRSSAWRSEG
jgi:hypothetical protein